MEIPQIRPGKVARTAEMPRVVAYFYNSAQGNSVIQLLAGMGVPGDRLGITSPDHIEGGQGMLLSIGCPDAALVPKVEAVCRAQGAEIRTLRH